MFKVKFNICVENNSGSAEYYEKKYDAKSVTFNKDTECFEFRKSGSPGEVTNLVAVVPRENVLEITNED